jgi:D-glycero-D-manno-heptose 1,7-bisphosphate phosphatase
MKRAVFLDRDGVINRAVVRNRKPFPPASLADLEILPGVGAAIDRLRAYKFEIIVVTNQPDVATGIQKIEVVEEMNESLRLSLGIDEVFVCYHVGSDRCDCRKPRPGMLTTAAKKRGIDLKSSFLVGDRWRDIDAGNAVGCYTYFIDYGYHESLSTAPDKFVASLDEASADIVNNMNCTLMKSPTNPLK